MPFWVITCMSKRQFMGLFHLQDDPTQEVSPEMPDIHMAYFNPNDYGALISSGEVITIALTDDRDSLFVVTYDGYLSNEVSFSDAAEQYEVEISVRGRLEDTVLSGSTRF